MKLKVDDSRLQARVKKGQENISKGLPLDLRLAGKRAAFYLMEATLPRSGESNQWPVSNFEKRIEADVKRAFPAVGDPRWQSSAYDLIRDAHGKDRADEFWRAVKSETGDAYDIESREQTHKSPETLLAAARKVKRRVDRSGYAALRKEKSIVRGRYRQLPTNTKPLAMPSASSRDSFLRSRKATIGLAKAGWYAADTALGGQRNFKKAQNEAGRFIWPSQLRKLQSKFGKSIGTGGVTMQGDGVGFWMVHNLVRYAEEAIPEALFNRAMQLGRNSMRIIFELRLKNRKTYELAA